MLIERPQVQEFELRPLQKLIEFFWIMIGLAFILAAYNHSVLSITFHIIEAQSVLSATIKLILLELILSGVIYAMGRYSGLKHVKWLVYPFSGVIVMHLLFAFSALRAVPAVIALGVHLLGGMNILLVVFVVGVNLADADRRAAEFKARNQNL